MSYVNKVYVDSNYHLSDEDINEIEIDLNEIEIDRLELKLVALNEQIMPIKLELINRKHQRLYYDPE